VDGLDWHWIFWLNVPVGLIAIPLAALVLRDSRGGASKLDPIGLVLSSAGVLALVWGVVHGAGDGWTSTGVLSTLIGGAPCSARSSPGSAGPPRRCCRCGCSVPGVQRDQHGVVHLRRRGIRRGLLLARSSRWCRA